MTYYIEQPYPFQGNQVFQNSSPTWEFPKQIQLCKDKLYTINFQAKDTDGDLLYYEMAEPIAGYSTSATYNVAPLASVGPYPIVNFINGHSKDKSIFGNPTLNINSTTGILTLRPNETGLFVFAVICKEFRNGKQIGLVQREIQMVIWDCPNYSKPKVSVEYNNQSVKEGSTLSVYRTNGGCADLNIVDTSSNSYVYVLNNISQNFENKYSLSLISGYPKDSLKGQFCIPKCNLPVMNPSSVQIIAKKFSCGLTLADTFNFQVEILDTSKILEPDKIPNIFTPNSDGFNDEFKLNDIISDNCENKYLRFEILNRWGNKIFSTTDRNITWDAINVPDGQYFYLIIFDNRKIKGIVQVIR